MEVKPLCDCCTKQSVFNLDCPLCVANFLKNYPRKYARDWWKRLVKELGPKHMAEVRRYL